MLALMRGLLSAGVLLATLTLSAPSALASPSYSIDGSGNNPGNRAWGSVGQSLLRAAPAAYGDGNSSPAGQGRPSARQISNALSAQTEDTLNNRGMSDFVYVFGQFLDHDIGLTETGSESLPISVPAGDSFFDPNSTGTKTMSFKRSAFAAGAVRNQTNSITAWIDGSQVYGSDATRAAALREFSGGRMKTSQGNMMPFNTGGLPNANDAHRVSDDKLFLAGDVRGNENVELIALQTLFVREHNRLAGKIAARSRRLSDEQIYQRARREVIGELQAITYNEFLPAILGRRIADWRGYRPNLNPQLRNEFSTGAFRFGHSLLDSEIQRLNNDGTQTPEGPISLREAFFNAAAFDTNLPDHRGDIDPYLKAASLGRAQEIDPMLIDDVRNFLFGAPGQGGFDLASLNIQRGRDHGLPDYNTVRGAYGLPRVASFSEITSDSRRASALSAQYGSVDNIDLWVGGLSEDHAPGSSLGPLFSRIIAEQFQRLRDSDRLFYLNDNGLRARVGRTTLSQVIMDNTALTGLPANVFKTEASTQDAPAAGPQGREQQAPRAGNPAGDRGPGGKPGGKPQVRPAGPQRR